MIKGINFRGISYVNLTDTTVELFGSDAKELDDGMDIYVFNPDYKGKPLAVIPGLKQSYGVFGVLLVLMLNRNPDLRFIVEADVKSKIARLGICTDRLLFACGDISSQEPGVIKSYGFDQDSVAL